MIHVESARDSYITVEALPIVSETFRSRRHVLCQVFVTLFGRIVCAFIFENITFKEFSSDKWSLK